MQLAFDSASVQVRVAVYRGFAHLLENPLSHSTLRQVLPLLQNCFHDRSESARVAMCELLLKVNVVYDIAFYDIVPVTHLLYRLATDTPSVQRRLVQLLLNSYFPTDVSAVELQKRTIALLRENTAAALVFYRLLPTMASDVSIVKYMGRVRKSLSHLVASKLQASNGESYCFVCVLL